MAGTRVTKPINPDRLCEELATAGVAIPNGVLTSGVAPDGSTTVYTVDEAGTPINLPAAAAAVLTAHDASVLSTSQRRLADSDGGLATLHDTYQTALTRLGNIQAAPAPTTVNLATITALYNAVKDLAAIEEALLHVQARALR